MDICKNVTIFVKHGENKESFTLQYASLSTQHPLFVAIRKLVLLGGVGSIQAIEEDTTKHVSLLRALQRSKKIRSLGAGYFALASIQISSIEEWLKKVVSHCRSPIHPTRCVEMILKQYPHGDQKEIEKWLQRKYKSIIVDNN